MPHPNSRMTTAERFLCKVDLKDHDSCWCWKAVKNHDGYGQFRWGRRMVRSHRAAYAIFVSEIPDGKIVAHKCDNPSCVNPSHLWLADVVENVRDRDIKLRTGRGEKNRHAKLTEAKVKEIKGLIVDGKNNTEIANTYHIDRSIISRIRHGKAWSFV